MLLRYGPILYGTRTKPVLSDSIIKPLCAAFSTGFASNVAAEITSILNLQQTAHANEKEKGIEEEKEKDDLPLSAIAAPAQPVIRKDEDGIMRITRPFKADQEDGYIRSRQGPKPVNMMKQLKHFQYYPPRIQKWVSYARMPKGAYNTAGYWKNNYSAMAEEVANREKLSEEGRRRQATKEAVEQREQYIRDNPLPPDLVGKYRFGVQPEETVDLNPKMREWLTFRHANNSEINKYRIDQAMLKWQGKPYDTGSTGVQIAVLTERINYVTAHLMKHKGDVKSKLGLRGLINKRYKLMKYCKRKNVTLYYDLIKDLNIKDMA